MDIFIVVVEEDRRKYIAADFIGDQCEGERQEVFLTFEHAKEVMNNQLMYEGKYISIHQFEV